MRKLLISTAYRRVSAIVFAAGIPWGLGIPGLLMYMTAGISDLLHSAKTGHTLLVTGDSGHRSISAGQLLRALRTIIAERHPVVAAMNLLAIWLLVTSLFAESPLAAFGATLAIIVTAVVCFRVIIPSMLDDKKNGRLALAAYVVSAASGALFLYLQNGLDGISLTLRVRPHLPFVEVNRLGNLMAMAVLCSLLLSESLQPRLKVLPFLAAIAQTAALVATKTRGAWLGLAAGIAVIVAANRSAKVLGIAIVVLAIFGLLLANIPGAIDRLHSIVSLDRNQDRIRLWRAGLEMVRDRPLLGFGMDNFSKVYDRYRLSDRPSTGAPSFAHNIFIDFAASAGIPGLLLAAVTLLGTLALGVRHLVLRPGPQWLAYLLALYVVQLAHMQVDLIQASPMTMPLLFMPMGVLIRHCCYTVGRKCTPDRSHSLPT